MSDAAWYQRRLAAMRGVPVPPQGRPEPVYYQQPQQQQYYQQPPQYQQQQPLPPPPPPPQQVSMTNLLDMQKQGHRVVNAGPGQRANPDPCPSCGGNQYFENLMVSKRGPSPAGHCYNCFAGTQEYLTEEGIRTFADTVGTTQIVLNHEGKWVEAEIREFGTQHLRIVTFRPGLRRSNLRHHVSVTSDHRWLTVNRGEVTDLQVGDDVCFIGGELHQPLVRADAWVRGFGFGDGTLDTRGQARVRLCGDKASYEERFALVGHYRRYETDDDPYLVFDKGHFSDWKQLPHSEDQQYLSTWLWGYIAADGEAKKEGYWRLSSQDATAVEFVKQVAPYAGLMVTGHNIESSAETNYGPRSGRLHRLTLRPGGVFRVTNLEILDEPEPVFCAVVEDGHSFVLANGILTSNCGYNGGMFTQGDQATWQTSLAG